MSSIVYHVEASGTSFEINKTWLPIWNAVEFGEYLKGLKGCKILHESLKENYFIEKGLEKRKGYGAGGVHSMFFPRNMLPPPLRSSELCLQNANFSTILPTRKILLPSGTVFPASCRCLVSFPFKLISLAELCIT